MLVWYSIQYFFGQISFNKIFFENGENEFANAKEVTLCVQENVYLKIKQAKWDEDSDFFKLQRYESHRWDNDFKTGNIEENYRFCMVEKWPLYGRMVELSWSKNDNLVKYWQEKNANIS